LTYPGSHSVRGFAQTPVSSRNCSSDWMRFGCVNIWDMFRRRPLAVRCLRHTASYLGQSLRTCSIVCTGSPHWQAICSGVGKKHDSNCAHAACATRAFTSSTCCGYFQHSTHLVRCILTDEFSPVRRVRFNFTIPEVLTFHVVVFLHHPVIITLHPLLVDSD